MASIRKRTNKWQVQIRRAGHGQISKSFTLRKDAVEWARDRERQADRGDLPKDGKVLRELTLGDLIRRYRDAVSVHKAGYENECIVFNAFLKHRICLKTLAELRTEDFAEYRDERLTTIKPTTLKRQLNPIHHAFELARDEWGLPIKNNPLRKLKLKLNEKARERRLRPGEEERLIAATAKCRNSVVLPVIMFALATAMRRGEILAMTWADVDLHRKCLLIPESKNGESRTIPLIREAIAILERQSRTQNRVFPITANSLRLAWDRVLQRAGIADLHFHDLRHEAISRLFEQGLTVPEVALISGHKNAKMLFRYAHAVRENILEKMDRANPYPVVMQTKDDLSKPLHSCEVPAEGHPIRDEVEVDSERRQTPDSTAQGSGALADNQRDRRTMGKGDRNKLLNSRKRALPLVDQHASAKGRSRPYSRVPDRSTSAK